MPFFIRLPLVILFLAMTPALVKADTFIVTSKADTGPGTLRDAIEKANANGTAVKDLIHFNLPGTTMENRTIIVADMLPALTSNIDIDGTTQPGAAFGISDAKVRIYKDAFNVNTRFYLFRLSNVEKIGIYGLYLVHDDVTHDSFNAISIVQSHDIIIGDAGKGNVIITEGYYIDADCLLGRGNSYGIRISYNFFGYRPDGYTILNGYSTVGFWQLGGEMVFWSTGDVEVDHNLFNGKLTFEEAYDYPIAADKRRYRIHDNRGGVDHTGMEARKVAFLRVNLHPASDPGNATNIDIRDNHLVYGNVALRGGKIVVQGNKINTDPAGTTPMVGMNNTYYYENEPALTISEAIQALVGGTAPGDKNYIASGSTGVSFSYDDAVTVSRNSIFCNGSGISSRETVFIETTNGNIIAGRSEPGAVIEIFGADACGRNQQCQGKVYIASTTADANGRWSYTGTVPTQVVATGTNSRGATSEFTRATINFDNIQVTHSHCGAPGSITGVVVTGADAVRWEDMDGNVLSNTTDLHNLAPGRYRMRATLNGDFYSDCNAAVSNAVEILDATPVITSSYIYYKTDPCGSNPGSINASYITHATRYVWRNQRDEVVSDNIYPELWNVPAGTYRMYAYATPTCFDVSDPVTLVARPQPVIDLGNMHVTPESCGSSNGSITGVTATGLDPLIYTWYQEGGNIMVQQPDLTDVPAGRYVLHVRDIGDCATTMSTAVEINAVGIIALDGSAMVVTPAGCNGIGGALTGMSVTGASAYAWKDEYGNTAGITTDLPDVQPGKYRLTATNTYGCSKQSDWLEVGIAPSTDWQLEGDVRPPICNEANGEITLRNIQGGSIQDIRWEDETTGAVLSHNRILSNISPGKYVCYITDRFNCEKQVFRADIPGRINPVIGPNMLVANETCGMANGSIRSPQILGEAPVAWNWTNSGDATVAITADAAGLKAGIYTLEIKDQYGCTARSAAYEVLNDQAPMPELADQTFYIAKGQTLDITVAYPYPALFSLYADATGQTTAFQSNNGIFNLPAMHNDVTYYLVANVDVCKSNQAELRIDVVERTDVMVPTAFTPNGDGQNDIFRPKYAGIRSLDYFKVFDRWGTQVFATNTFGAGWDGKDAAAGSYIYSISGTDLLGKRFLKQGSVLLIK